MNSTYFGLLAEFGEANIPLEKLAPKYFGLSYEVFGLFTGSGIDNPKKTESRVNGFQITGPIPLPMAGALRSADST